MRASHAAASAWVAIIVALLAGCSNGSAAASNAAEPAYQTLVLLEGWSSLERAADPFVVSAGAAPACVGPSFRLEGEAQWLEIDTGLCNWVTLAGSARAAVSEEQMVQLSFSHYDLDATAPAEAELKLAFGDCEALEEACPHSQRRRRLQGAVCLTLCARSAS